ARDITPRSGRHARSRGCWCTARRSGGEHADLRARGIVRAPILPAPRTALVPRPSSTPDFTPLQAEEGADDRLLYGRDSSRRSVHYRAPISPIAPPSPPLHRSGEG